MPIGNLIDITRLIQAIGAQDDSATFPWVGAVVPTFSIGASPIADVRICSYFSGYLVQGGVNTYGTFEISNLSRGGAILQLYRGGTDLYWKVGLCRTSSLVPAGTRLNNQRAGVAASQCVVRKGNTGTNIYSAEGPAYFPIRDADHEPPLLYLAPGFYHVIQSHSDNLNCDLNLLLVDLP